MNRGGPAIEVREPDEGAAAGVDDVERLGGKRLGAVADVRGEKVGRDTGGFGLAVRQLDLLGADVDAGDVGAGVGPGERFLAAAALEVAKMEAVDVAGGCKFVLAQQRSALGEEVGEWPDGASRFGDGVPGGAVGGGVIVQRTFVLGVGLERSADAQNYGETIRATYEAGRARRSE